MRYAFKALSYLVQKKNDGPVLISEIAEIKNILLKFLENILLQLKKAEILDSKKGKGGGYFFQVNSAENFHCHNYPLGKWPHRNDSLCKS